LVEKHARKSQMFFKGFFIFFILFYLYVCVCVGGAGLTYLTGPSPGKLGWADLGPTYLFFLPSPAQLFWLG
jgi:uncharacterized SAM-binding protein YcdF (DUF218 family)